MNKIKDIFPLRKIWHVVGLIAILGIVAVFAFGLERGYNGRLAGAAGDSQNLAFAVERHAADAIQKTDLVLNRLVDEFSPEQGGERSNPQRISSYLLRLRLKQPELKSLRVVKADGNVLYSLYTVMEDGDAVSPLFLGDEAFFTAHRDHPNLGLTLSGPAPGRDLILSRRLNNPDGSFAGIAAATIGLTYFEAYYATLNPGKNGSLTLLNDKLAILARFPAGDGMRGKSLAGSGLEAQLRNNPGGATYSGVSPLDGVERIDSVRQVGDLPLYVDAGLAKQDVLAEWRRDALIYSAGLALLIVAMLFMAYGRQRRPDAGQNGEEKPPSSPRAGDPNEAGRDPLATIGADERLLKFENHALEIVCGDASLDATLDLLCRGMEEILDDALCAIMLLDDERLRLRLGAAPSLPDGYHQVVDGIAIGPAAGTCAAAAHAGQQVVTTDIATDPLWGDDKDVALSHGLAACCATPIYSETDDLLGIFAVYYRTPYQPTPFDLQADNRAAYLASVAIRRKGADEAAHQLNETLQQRVADLVAKMEAGRAEHLTSIALLRKRADEALNQLKEDMEQRAAADAATKMEVCRAEHLASIALLRRRADESLSRLEKDMAQRAAEEAARVMEQERGLAQRSRLAVASEIIGNVAQQWRQPLNALDLMLANIKVAQKFQELDPRMLLQSTVEGRQIIHGMLGTIDDFRNFFNAGKEKVAFSLNDRIQGAIATLAASLRDHNIEVQVEAGDDVIAYGFPGDYSQVLLGIFNNAQDALVANKVTNGVIHIRAVRVGEQSCVIVRDNAGGIPSEILGEIFEPSLATRHKGAGIGLCLSKMIIEDGMDGKIAARNVEGGAEFVVTCPIPE